MTCQKDTAYDPFGALMLPMPTVLATRPLSIPFRTVKLHKPNFNSSPLLHHLTFTIPPSNTSLEAGQPPSPQQSELAFLALHHLHQHDSNPLVRSALSNLEQALSSSQLLPTSFNYTGAEVSLTYDQCVERYSHIPHTYIRDVLRSRLPKGPPYATTLLARGRHSTAIRKRLRPPRLDISKSRWRPDSHNVATLVDQQTYSHSRFPFDRATFALLPKAFRKLKRLVGHHLPVFTAVFDHSSCLVITGSDDHLIKIWSTDTGYLQHTLRGHNSDIIEIVKHPTRHLIVSASADTTLRVWNINTGAALHVLDGGSKEVNAVQFSPCPDRPYVVSGGADGSVRLWNADDFSLGFIRIPIPDRNASRNAAAVSTDTRRAGAAAAAAATSRAAPSSPVAENAPAPTPSVPTTTSGPSTTPPFSSPPRRTLPSSSPPPPPLVAPRRMEDRSASALVHPGAPHIQRSTSDPPPQRYPPANSMVSGTPMYGVLSVGFNAGATRLAVAGTDCVVYLYAIEKDENSDAMFPQIRFLAALRGHSQHIIQVLFSRTGDSIVTACRDGTARIWNRTKACLPAGKKRMQSVAGMGRWSSVVLDCRPQMQADARSMLSGGASGSACGSIIPRMRRPIFPVTVDAAMWSLTDKYVFTASSDAKIRMWHADSGKLARVFEEHEREVYVMDCHPTDKRILLSAGYDGKCILWDIETGKQLKRFSIPEENTDQNAHFGSATSISDGQFSADGLSFAVSDTSGAITLFGVGSPEMMALAPVEQFFSNDYAPYRRDAQNRATDENTGLLLHLVPKGRLCDRELRPHAPELQPNLLLPPRLKSDTNGNCGGLILPQSQSTNAVQNKNRDALLLRAREFRENQEKEERRLLREAREARRSLIVEKEKAALERDIPYQLALRDFEVQDSDYDDSDEDFDGENAHEISESTSSSEDEDEVRPVRKQKNFTVERIRTNEFGTALRRPRSRPGLRKLRSFERGTIESGNSDGGEESPGYEIESGDGESDNSVTSSDAEEEVKPRHIVMRSLDDSRALKVSEPVSNNKVQSAPRDGQGKILGKTYPSLHSPGSQVPPPRLGGASVSDKGRRMKINLNNTVSGGPSSVKVVSSPMNLLILPSRDADFRAAQIDNTLTQQNIAASNRFASVDVRGQTSDAAFAGMNTPRNPSFTSERQDRTAGSRSSKPVEDHQGDTASCIRPSRATDDFEEQRGAAHSRHNLTQQHSSGDKSPRMQRALNVQMDSGSKSEVTNAVLHTQKVEGNEKSLLSDSPARLIKRKWRTRTRSGAAKNEGEVLTPVVDIDELAERELQLLEEEGSRNQNRRRRRRSALDYSDKDGSSDDGQKRSNRDDPEDSEVPRRSRKRAKGTWTGGAKEKPNPESCEDGSIELSASAWLRSSSNRYTYVPQLGDDVMYFPEGHASAISISREAGVDPLLGKAMHKKVGKEILDGTTFSREAPPVRFQIMDVSYDFPATVASQKPRSVNTKAREKGEGQEPGKKKTVVMLTLRMISGLKKRVGQNDRFVLAYYPVDAPEYLVLTSRVEGALYRSWKASDRFRILFLNEHRAWQYYTGTIRTVKQSIKTVMWNTVEVEYDNESEIENGICELVSPWELETYDLVQGAREASFQYSQSLRSSTVEPGLFPVIAKEFEIIRAMESNWRAQLSCLDTVDTLASIPGYCNKIPCPMDINTLLVRLCTGYYRHFCSFIHDISLLKNNAIRFHGAQSEMGILCINLFTRLAETAERIRHQYVASMPVQSMPMSHSGSRAIRPRPVLGDGAFFSNPSPSQAGPSNHGRQFPVPQTRQTAPISTLLPQYISDTIGHQTGPSGSQQKLWQCLRPIPSGSNSPTTYVGQSMGVGLPPAQRGLGPPGVVSRGGRASRGRNRDPQSGRQGCSGQSRRASGVSVTRASVPSPPHAPPPPQQIPIPLPIVHSNGAPYTVPPYLIHSLLQPNQFAGPGAQVTMVANSSQTNEGTLGLGKRIAPSSALSQGLGITKPSVQVGGAQAMASAVSPENGTMTNGRGYGNNGISSPTQGGVGFGPLGVSMTQASPYGSISRHQNRGGSAAGDGATHSWGRSMEGAGGTFPLQASTSDSHLPVPTQTGRSPSPTSPSPRRQDNVNPITRHQGVSGVAGNVTPYHEHSTISVAAAESTMSCGGADVALHAASAESAEVGSERNRS